MAYSTINKPTDHFNTVLYTGNGTSQSITGIGFQPDWVWVKARSSTAGHRLFDVVRGDYNLLESNSANAEANNTNQISLDADGFSTGSSVNTNSNSVTYASWNWLASNTTASNTDGSITSTVSANTTSGFSIVTYTGNGTSASFGHGLTSPKVVIIKDRSAASTGWYFHTTAIDGSDDYLYLNQDVAKSDAGSGYSIGTSVYNLGGAGGVTNLNGNNYVAYCFQEIKGYSKFGIYTGNGSSDGPFIYTGFKPAFTLIKKSSASGSWWEMVDNKRSPSNVMDNTLYSNVANTEFESSSYNRDFVSNGFKIRNTNSADNTSGETYIYMAFAEAPLVGTNNIPATAR